MSECHQQVRRIITFSKCGVIHYCVIGFVATHFQFMSVTNHGFTIAMTLTINDRYNVLAVSYTQCFLLKRFAWMHTLLISVLNANTWNRWPSENFYKRIYFFLKVYHVMIPVARIIYVSRNSCLSLK